MTYVVTSGSVVKCAHGGTVSLTSTQTKLKVAGQPTVGPLDVVGASIAGCTVVVTPSSAPCTLVVSVIAGPASTLLVDKKPVLLDNARGLTNGVPPGTWSVLSAGHSCLAAS